MREEKYPKIVMPQCQAEKILKGQKTLVDRSGFHTFSADSESAITSIFTRNCFGVR